MAGAIDNVMPVGRWQFDGDVTDVFDDMLARSIPHESVMRELVNEVACRFVQPGTVVADLGCSRGAALGALVERFGDGNRFFACDVSEPMLEAARARFGSSVQVVYHDLRSVEPLPFVGASVVLAVLTLQFTPIEQRFRILRRIHDSLAPGGALMLVEKVLGSSAESDELLVNAYYDMKRRNGYTDEQIDRKRLSLEGVLVPVTAEWNEAMLGRVGFRPVECFWRSINFAGWFAVK